jgi:6,7-dimethyl-8-ribityllumazine synthase
MSNISEVRGSLEGAGRRFAVVVSRFNEVVTEELLDGAVKALRDHGVAATDIEIVRVPGAWELPAAASRIARRGGLDGIIALGCVIRGETPHFDYVAGEAAHGLAALSRDFHLPVSFGVLTTETLEQALVRAGNGGSNRGADAALSALEMANLYRELS